MSVLKNGMELKAAARMRARAWIDIIVTAVRPSVDPSKPPLYLTEIKGKRGDGMVITVPIYVEKSKFDVLPPAKAIESMMQVVNGGLKQLMTFTGCACTVDKECEQHKTNVLVH